MNEKHKSRIWNVALVVFGLAVVISSVFVGVSVVAAQNEQRGVVIIADSVSDAVQRDIDVILPQVRVQVDDAIRVSNDADRTVFDNLTVNGDETIEGNVIVYDGNVHVKDGGRITGDLVVYNGNITVDDGGRIDGNASTFSGNIRIDGKIGGNLTTWNGDVDLRDDAVVDGDISVLNGNVKRAEGARIGGNIVRGPNLELPEIPKPPFNFGVPEPPTVNAVSASAPSIFARIGRLLLRSITMLLLAVAAGVVIWLIAQVRSDTVKRTQKTLSEQSSISFVVGIVTNIALLMVGGLFAITICLIPITVIAYLLLFSINIVGWAGLSATISQRMIKRYNINAPWEQVTAVTAMLIAAVFGLLWAFGGCFRFFGFAGILVLSSVGAGAVLMPFLHKHLGLGNSTESPTDDPDGGPASRTLTDVELTSSDYIVEESSESADDTSASGSTEPAESRPSVSEPAGDAGADDLLRISGLGPVAAERLRSAGIDSAAKLAQMSAEQIGEILRWSPERVQQARIIEQAKALSQ